MNKFSKILSITAATLMSFSITTSAYSIPFNYNSKNNCNFNITCKSCPGINNNTISYILSQLCTNIPCNLTACKLNFTSTCNSISCKPNSNNNCKQTQCLNTNISTNTVKTNSVKSTNKLQTTISNNKNTISNSRKTVNTSVKKPEISKIHNKTNIETKAIQNNTINENNSSMVSYDKNFENYQKEVLNIVNSERSRAGLSPLKFNAELNKIATLKSQDMYNKNYFSHTSPTYGSPFQMIQSFGISYRSAGENIAMGQRSPKEVMNGWMNSSGHRANILNGNFTEIGIGIAKSSNGTLYWTQMFIGK